MKKILLYISIIPMMATGFSQSEKFDIATFIPPQGWQRLDSNGVLAFHDERMTNGQTSFGQIVLFPSWTSNNTAEKNFRKEWDDRVAKTVGDKTKPTTQTEKTPDGWTVVTGTANLSAKGMTYACILVTASGFEKVISVMVNTAGSDHASTIEKFFNDLNLDSKATVTETQQINNSNRNQTIMAGTISMNNFDFIPPQGWQVQNSNEHILIQNMASGCAIRIITPQPSSGDLEKDAQAVFEMMYAGWQYQKSGEQKYVLSKGFLPKGLEYYMMEAPMSMTSADGRYNLEEGAALVVKAGNQVVIISIRHNSSALGHNDCQHNYNTMGRFFNSFTVKNSTVPENKEEVSSKIIGAWSQTESGASSEYVFAANGNYALIGAIGSTYTSSDYRYDYIHIKTYAFQGDGSYSISGAQLTLNNRINNSPELLPFRFEKINHGGTGWNDRICLLKRDATVGKEYEVCYERRKP